MLFNHQRVSPSLFLKSCTEVEVALFCSRKEVFTNADTRPPVLAAEMQTAASDITTHNIPCGTSRLD